MLNQLMANIVLDLSSSSPFPESYQVSATAVRPSFHSLSGLPYPSICLLIAAMHAQTAGHDIVTLRLRVFYKLISICLSLLCVFILQAFEMLVLCVGRRIVATAAPSATMAC